MTWRPFTGCPASPSAAIRSSSLSTSFRSRTRYFGQTFGWSFVRKSPRRKCSDTRVAAVAFVTLMNPRGSAYAARAAAYAAAVWRRATTPSRRSRSASSPERRPRCGRRASSENGVSRMTLAPAFVVGRRPAVRPLERIDAGLLDGHPEARALQLGEPLPGLDEREQLPRAPPDVPEAGRKPRVGRPGEGRPRESEKRGGEGGEDAQGGLTSRERRESPGTRGGRARGRPSSSAGCSRARSSFRWSTAPACRGSRSAASRGRSRPRRPGCSVRAGASPSRRPARSPRRGRGCS